MVEELENLMTQFALLAVVGYVLWMAFGDKLPKCTTNTEVSGSGTAPLLYGQTRL